MLEQQYALRGEAVPVIETLHVTGLTSLAPMAARLGRVDLLTLMSPNKPEEKWSRFKLGQHVILTFNDIIERRPGLIMPDAGVVLSVLEFGRNASKVHPMLIHCWAGISRSSAAAYIIVCDRNPGHELAIARELRRRSPYVTPNALMVSLADDLLARGGAMREAIAEIGRGADAFEGAPYELPLLF